MKNFFYMIEIKKMVQVLNQLLESGKITLKDLHKLQKANPKKIWVRETDPDFDGIEGIAVTFNTSANDGRYYFNTYTAYFA